MKTITLIIFFCFPLFVYCQIIWLDYTDPVDPAEPVIFRPDLKTCARFHTTVARNEVECVQRHPIYGSIFCHFECNDSALRLHNCRILNRRGKLKYPACSDIYCRDIKEGPNCSDIPSHSHSENTDESYEVMPHTHLYP